MKTIITTVGTSIFTNLTKDGENEKIARKYEDLKEIRFSDWEKNKPTIETLRSLVNTVIKKRGEKASAEIESILKIAKGEKVIIHLLATDTILSVLAAEIIKDWFKDKQTVHFNAQYGQDVIQNLQVENLTDFKVGLTNLVTRFYSIVQQYYNPNDYILNITGGYKGLIPFVTILGQITKISIQYKFEDTEGIIEIPRLPIQRNNELFEKYTDVFQQLEENELDTNQFYQFSQDAESCLEFFENGKKFMLNSLGWLFWEDYKKNFFSFLCTEDVWNELQKQENNLSILKTKFWNKEQRDNKTGPKLEHKTVYDDGKNTNRIFFFEQDGKIYLYKTFSDSYNEYDRYWRSVKFSDNEKNEIIKNSKLRKIKIENV